MKILLTDGGSKNTLAIIRYLGQKNHQIHILHHKISFPAKSKYCDKHIFSPNITDHESYSKFLISLCQTNHYDLLIPVGARAVSIIVNNYQKLSEYINVIVPNIEKLNIALNKQLTYQYAGQIGIKVPKTIYPSSLKDAFGAIDQLKFPVIAKSSNESINKFPTIYINDISEFQTKVEKAQKNYNLDFTKNFPLIQEQIVGDGYGFFAVYHKGECKSVFMHKRIREFPPSGGISSSAISIYDQKLLEIGKKILDSLQWNGQAMVEFKKDFNTGEFILIEINPKFWGSLELGIISGVNFPNDLVRIAENTTISFNDSYRINQKFHWLFSYGGEFYRLIEKPIDIFKVICNIFNYNVKSEIWLSDFRPNIKEFFDFLKYLKVKLLK